MRWDELFRDLEGQLAAAEAADLAAEVADRTRRESALLTLADRARGAVGSRVGMQVRGVGRVDGVLVAVAPEWLLVADDSGREVLAPLAAATGLTGLGVWSAPPAGQVAARLGLAGALRALARDRARVTVGLVDGGAVVGTIDRVGADFLEVSDRTGESPAVPPSASTSVWTVPTAAVAVVRAAG